MLLFLLTRSQIVNKEIYGGEKVRRGQGRGVSLLTVAIPDIHLPEDLSSEFGGWLAYI